MSEAISTRTPSRVPLRIGLVLGALLLLAALPGALDVGFDGSGMDVVVVAIAILSAGAAIAMVVCVFLAWRGRRGPIIGAIIALAVSVATSLPALVLVATGAIPLEVLIPVGVGVVATVVALVLVATGLRRA